MKHTPIPWKLGSKPTDYSQVVESSDGTVLAITGNDGANAAFIVRAVNNHAKLLEALEEGHVALLSAILFIEGAFPEPRGTLLQDELTSYRMREVKARAAIEEAKK